MGIYYPLIHQEEDGLRARVICLRSWQGRGSTKIQINTYLTSKARPPAIKKQK